MNNYDLIKLYEDYEEAYNTNPHNIIAFADKNKDVLHEVNDFAEVEYFKKFMAIATTYVKSLVDTGRYNRAIDEALIFLPVIEKNMIFLNLDPKQETWYLSILFQKGYAHYQLSDYKFALKHFKQLLKYTPDSDKIKVWVDYAWYGTLKGYLTAILIVATILVIVPIALKNRLPPWPRLTMTTIGLVLVGVHTWLGYRIKKNRRTKT